MRDPNVTRCLQGRWLVIGRAECEVVGWINFAVHDVNE